MRPGYDAYGWLVWGRQLLKWNMNTSSAPSWKPLTFLFTAPYALTGSTQPTLWMITSTAGAFASAVFAGRIAYKLTDAPPGRGYARVVAVIFAALGVLGIEGLGHLVLIANSDQVVVALCLGAIDLHLSGRPWVAFWLLWLAALGRPEAWAFLGLYALWIWWKMPSRRVPTLLALVAVPVFWFGGSALTSPSWFAAGNEALNQGTVIHGNKVFGVIGRFAGQYELPMQLAVGFALVLAVVRRDRVALTLAGAAALWVVIEIVLAYGGWSAVARYLIEPAAVMVVLAGAAVGWLLAVAPDAPPALRWVGPALVARARDRAHRPRALAARRGPCRDHPTPRRRAADRPYARGDQPRRRGGADPCVRQADDDPRLSRARSRGNSA